MIGEREGGREGERTGKQETKEEREHVSLLMGQHGMGWAGPVRERERALPFWQKSVSISAASSFASTT